MSSSESLDEMIERCNREYLPFLKEYAYRFVDNDSDAMDLIQYAFVRLLIKRKKIPELRFKYFKGLIQFLKNDIRWRALTESKERSRFSDVASYKSGIFARSKWRADDGDVRVFIDQVCSRRSDRFSRIAQLKFLDGYRNMEIASELNCSKNAIDTAVSRSRSMIKKEILIG